MLVSSKLYRVWHFPMRTTDTPIRMGEGEQ